MVWKHPTTPAATRLIPRLLHPTTPATKNVLVTAFWEIHGALLVEFLPTGTTVNAITYAKTLTKLCRTLRCKRPRRGAANVRLIMTMLVHMLQNMCGTTL